MAYCHLLNVGAQVHGLSGPTLRVTCKIVYDLGPAKTYTLGFS